MQYEIRFLLALALTVSVEGAVVIAALRLFPLFRKRKVSWTRCFVAGMMPSITTLPYLWFILPMMLSTYLLRLIIGESVIFMVETVLIRFLVNIRWKHAVLLSFIANGASIIAGLLVFR